MITLKIEEAEILSHVKYSINCRKPANYRDQVISYTPTEKGVPRQFMDITRVDSHHRHEDRPSGNCSSPLG